MNTRHPIGSHKVQAATEIAHSVIAEAIYFGDCVIDATCGNGFDTEFFAEHIGPAGIVFAFDIQREAIEETKARLFNRGFLQRVALIQTCHSRMEEIIPINHVPPIQAIMYNLGYLPHGLDKSIITRPDTTVASLQQAVRLLSPGGRMTIVYYTGHEGGEEEFAAINTFLEWLDAGQYVIDHHPGSPEREHAPGVFAVTKEIIDTEE